MRAYVFPSSPAAVQKPYGSTTGVLGRAVAVAACTFLISALISACTPREQDADPASDTLAFVGRETCAGCHEEAAAAWTGSDHDRAMEEPTPETILGDFDDAVFQNCGVETRFFREGGDPFVRTQGPRGTAETYRVAYTFGHSPLQQVLLPLEGGRLQAFTVAWDAERERWFSLTPDECPGPGDFLHWTGGGMNWNYMCADCHSTNLRRNFDLSTERYETSFAEIDVSCEACHGPGETHVERVRSGEVDAASSGLPVTSPHRQVDVCASCHARRRVIHPDHVAGKPFLDHYDPELLEDGLYFADGQIQDEVYVYGSFLQSKMYAQGVTCSNCHDPHSATLKFEGNALCIQCHDAATYDTFEHVRHPESAEGSRCVDCHMPERTYMVVDPRRDHGFKVPRPDLSAELGTPNACTSCHTDRAPEWAAERIADWHGPERPPTFARALAAGRTRSPEGEPALMTLVGDAATPAIVRATGVGLLGRYATVRAADAVEDALRDSSALVRTAALRSLSAMDDAPAVEGIEPLLRDPVRLVRVEAARVLTLLAPGRYAREDASPAAPAYWSALREYREGQVALGDQAASHLNLAVIHEQLGGLDSAAAAYRTALKVDSTFVPAHLNLAMLYNRMRDGAGPDSLAARAESSLRTAVRLQPGMAEAHYTLGLLLAETPERLAEAADHLEQAARLDTTNARMQYNAGLARQQLGQAAAAEVLLRRAGRLEPDQPDYLNALSVFYAQQGAWSTALDYTGRLLQHVPDNAEIQRRAAYIREQMP